MEEVSSFFDNSYVEIFLSWDKFHVTKFIILNI